MRLIDADKLLDMLFRADLDYESMGGVDYCIDKIEGQPTVYDADKIINQLSTKMFSAELHGDEWNGQTVDNLLCMGDVYEILKGGGMDE